jgi:hypothetical protein
MNYVENNIGNPQQFFLHIDLALREGHGTTFWLKFLKVICLDNYNRHSSPFL